MGPLTNVEPAPISLSLTSIDLYGHNPLSEAMYIRRELNSFRIRMYIAPQRDACELYVNYK
ncbi:hypothetical protein KTT_12090 [Tengunoibacter tsumagoiensis]|uniref:Uncharacterized protein n=1 Tax=Tengunoibacter tsumagoiensis TaxID=2014871 RepID=A0A401ZX17_9CHLR|nr:hypothetical protein KTT_12090 [Tengunoibacter tsumagoiensis]